MHITRALATTGITALTVLTGASPAAADPVARGQASSYGATVEVGGQAVVPPTPTAEVTAPPPGTASNTVIDIPAEPLAVSGTLTASATVHQASDIPTALTVVEQQVAGPYNATATSLVEGLRVLLDAPEEGLSLLSADAVRSEAAAVCSGGTVQYTASSEIIDLRVGGEQIPLNAPVQDLIDAISGLLADTGLNQVVDVQRNVVTPTADGISVDALVVTVLAAAGETPLGRVVIGHAEVSAAQCGTMPQCSDGEDNDGDGRIDHPADPDCDSPEDNSEFPECSDGVDNADPEDERADQADPGCHSDGDAGNPASFDPNDDDETDVASTQPQTQGQQPGGTLARTGGESTVALAAGLAALGLAGLALRRRITA